MRRDLLTSAPAQPPFLAPHRRVVHPETNPHLRACRTSVANRLLSVLDIRDCRAAHATREQGVAAWSLERNYFDSTARPID